MSPRHATGFGTDPGCLSAACRLPFATAFDRAQRTVMARFWVPCWRLLELLVGSRGNVKCTPLAFFYSIANLPGCTLSAAPPSHCKMWNALCWRSCVVQS